MLAPTSLGLSITPLCFKANRKPGATLATKPSMLQRKMWMRWQRARACFDTSKITSAAVGRAQDALSQAEGHAADLLDRADNKLAGNGMYLEGGHFDNLQGKATQKVNIDILQLYRAVASYRYRGSY